MGYTDARCLDARQLMVRRSADTLSYSLLTPIKKASPKADQLLGGYEAK